MGTPKNGRLPRGSNPPFMLLSEAFRLAQSIWENAGGHCSLDMFSKITGNSTSSSSFIRRLNALKSYGLVSEADNLINLTDQGRESIAPTSLTTGAAARKACFLSLDVHSKLYERHKGKLLPAAEFLRNIIEQDCKIPKDLLDAWIASFKDAARAAGVLLQRNDGKFQLTEEALTGNAPQSQTEVANGKTTNESQATSATTAEERPRTVNVEMNGTGGHTTKIEVSGRRYAVFSFPDSLTPRDAQKLKGALAGLSAIIDSMVHEDEN